MAITHDTFRHNGTNNVAFAAASGASAASNAFAVETQQIRVVVQGALTATSGVRIQVGDGTPTATSSSPLLPVNWVECIKVTPGQKIAVLSNDTVTGTLSVTELTD